MSAAIRTRLAKGLGGEVYARLVTVLVQLAGVPIFLHAWGAPLYGEWLILAAIPWYLTMSDAGFARAGTNEMTMLVARDERATALAVFQSTWLLVTAVSLLVGSAVVIALWWLPVGDWLGLTRLDGRAIATILALLVTHILVSLQTSVLNAGFTAEGAYGLGTVIANTSRLFEFCLLAATVLAGGGPMLAAAALVVGRTLGNVVMRVILRRRVPWLRYGVAHADRATVRRLARPALAFLGYPLGDALGIQGFVLAIGAVLGPSAVVVFATLRTMTRLVPVAVTAISYAVAPEFARAFGAGDRALLRRLHRRAVQVTFWTAGPLLLALLALGAPLLATWTGGKVIMQGDLFLVLLAVAGGSLLWRTSLMVLYATNRHERSALTYLAANAAAVIAAALLAERTGLAGAAAALLIPEIAMTAVVVRAALALAGDRLSALAATMIRPPFFLLGRVGARGR